MTEAKFKKKWNFTSVEWRTGVEIVPWEVMRPTVQIYLQNYELWNSERQNKRANYSDNFARKYHIDIGKGKAVPL